MNKRRKKTVADEILSWYRERNKWTEATWKPEFKSGKGGFPRSFWESYSAFANTDGGVIIVGVNKDGVPEGIETAEKYRDDFSNILSSGTKCSEVLSGADDIAIVELDGKAVLAVRVQPASVAQKPVYLDGKPMCCYVRVGEGDRLCKADEVSRMLRDKDVVTQQYSADAEIIPDSSPGDLDVQTLLDYRKSLTENRRHHPWADLDDASLLMKLGAYRMDRKTGKYGLTLAGLLMFGRAETIRELHPIFRLDYFELDGSEKALTGRRWVDRITSDGTWEPNLYQFFFKVLPRLTSDLKRPFQLGVKLTRRDDSSAYEAVREALANAVIHADYREPGGVKVTKQPNGLLLENAGTLLMREEEVYAGGKSLCRNKNIQNMFKLIGIVEDAGSGVDVLMNGWSENFLCVPKLQEDRKALKVVWQLPYLAMLDKNVMLVQQEFLGYEKYARLSSAEKILLLMIPCDEYVSNQELRLFIPRLHSVDLGRMLSHLREEGYIQSKGRSNATRYGLVDRLSKLIKSLGDTLPPVEHLEKKSVSVVNPEKSSVVNEASSVVNPEKSSVVNVDSSVVTHAEKMAQELHLPDELCKALEAFRKKQRHHPEETDNMILALCEGRYISLTQMSVLLDRGAYTLRHNSLAPLIRHGRLSRLHAEKTHKDQAYTTSVPSE
ncbi:MAG: putative DNA binding domain-containing protein [Akkermansia sp.]|nr:putative DNA binding domain-containing protein [Akkermansia sp.]